MPDLETRLLMIMAAPFICGRPVRVRFKAPVSVGAYGTTTVRPDGTPEVRIDPELGALTLETYLHELAHIKLGHVDHMAKSGLHDRAPRSRPAEAAHQLPAIEKQAEAQAAAWLRYGRKHADPSRPEGEGIIYALVDYYQNQNQR